MADVKNKTGVNSISLKGYLKENNLTKMVTSTGKEAISGTLTIATNSIEDYRIRFMVCRFSNSGDANRTYTSLETMLPENTMSIATILKSDPQLSFEQAKQQATKLYAKGSFEEYNRKDTSNQIHSMPTIRGITAGICNENSKFVFVEEANFEVDAFVDYMKAEKNKEGEETGRLIVGLFIPDYYNKSGMTFDFMVDTDANKGYMGYYECGQSGHFGGILRNSREEVMTKGEVIEYLDGTVDENIKTSYSFVNERIINKIAAPYAEGNVKEITKDEVKAFKATRQTKIEELAVTPDRAPGNRGQGNFDGATPVATATSKKFVL